MSYTVEKNNFDSVKDLFTDIIDEMARAFDGGFDIVFPVSGTFNGAVDNTCTLQATTFVDSECIANPWRVRFDLTEDYECKMYIATPVQLPNSGEVTKLEGDPADSSGVLGTDLVAPGDPDYNLSRFYEKYQYTLSGSSMGAYPTSYRLTITNHGFALVVWEPGTDEGSDNQSWVVVQRPVDKTSGSPLITGLAPLFCIYGLDGSLYKQFVVRESDVNRPTVSAFANSNTEDARAVINTSNQVSITEDDKYVITFPNGLNTQRYMYFKELDLLAYTSADVIASGSDVQMTVYGEGTPRTYRAYKSNGSYNTGMRILVLIVGGGI